MNLKYKYIDELIEIREKARLMKDWDLSDEIRSYLDSKHAFVFDTEEGQIVYHVKNETRNSLINKLKKELRWENLFNGWLFSMNAKSSDKEKSSF